MHTPEETAAKLRQVGVLIAKGKPVLGLGAVRAIAVSKATYFRWRAEYGGLKPDQVERLKEVAAGLALEKVLLEAAFGIR